ncbi:MAG: hypothetical protein HN736_15235 [Anaerolineae bacterium]|jgi:hypothetical protein|nr:hypothetical protein [Anaerolineae bacterium]MBT4457753.1 hypothetical protein [Anaerolineae bacterium]MBT6061192.1 hypothetical protein [Anaerolineae bacterium]MBT6321144.1 hypothetical protein [Anaerolineae bacterium]MBT6812660.1 hypothetical protein [Anaerolineae bacterium]
MKKTRALSLLIILAFLALGGTSCAQQPDQYPSVWIDHPQDGGVFPVGVPVTVISHAFARAGVAEVVLSINGEPYRRDAPAEAGQDFVSLQQDWVPGEAGIYIIQVQAYDRQGQVGNPDSISIEAKGDTPTQIPTLVDTPLPLTATLVPTETPVDTATPVPTNTFPPPTYTFTPTLPPADTTSPPAPSPAVPASGLELTCRSTQTLVWLPVDDPSGITGYYVKLEREATPGNWQSEGGYGPVTGKQVDANVQCGGVYRWMVRAQDGAGNFSNWSAISYFSVAIS